MLLFKSSEISAYSYKPNHKSMRSPIKLSAIRISIIAVIFLIATSFSLFVISNSHGEAKSLNQQVTEVLVCISKNAAKYHSHECRGLAKCTHEVRKVTLAKAKEMGYSTCLNCYK